MIPEERSEQLKSWALEEGFDRAGTTRLTASQHGAALLAWLARGDQAGMTYMERRSAMRIDPRRLLPTARSVLCVALQYYPSQDEVPMQGDFWPRVARYARGRDYHDIMEAGLERLARRVLGAYPGTEMRGYVDTGPVLERELGARAGLGAIGKNTCLLHPEGGSWFVLGELLLSLPLADEPTVADLCGSCTACLEACPTGALPAPYRLDSRRCISYWTIEHRGEIPPDTRPLLQDWVFGCDICQEVCPVNAQPAAATHAEFRLPLKRGELDLVSLLSLDRAAYVQLFRGSPMKRARLEGLQRNAAVAMGNSGRTRYLPALCRALEEGERVVRQHAAWALGQIGGETAAAALRAAARREGDRIVQAEILSVLSHLTEASQESQVNRTPTSG